MATASVLAPLPVIAVALFLGWRWWLAIIPALCVVAVVAELAGIRCGVMAALVSTPAIILVIEGDYGSKSPHNGVELAAMAALLVVAVFFGTDSPPAD